MWIPLCLGATLAGLFALGLWAWRDHRRHRTPEEVFWEECRSDMKAAARSIRRSRRAGTMDDAVWLRELESYR